MFSSQHSRRWRAAVGVAAAGLLLGGGATLTADAQTPGLESEPLEFVALAPDRILDTRSGIGAASAGKVGPGETIELDVAGRTLSNGVTIPTNARAVMVNATSTEADAPTFITFFPSGQTRPNASTLNAVFGANSSGLGSENVPNMVTVSLGSNGDVAIFNLAGNTHVLADIAGYYVPAGSGVGGAASDPTGTCTNGEVFVNTITGQLFTCVNGAWVPGGIFTGPPGAPGTPGDPGLVSVEVTGLPVVGDLTLAVLQSGLYTEITTFTAPASGPIDGDYLLEAFLDVRFVGNPLLAVAAGVTVECRWNDGQDIVRGVSLTADLQLLAVNVPGFDVGNITVPGQAFDLDPGQTVELQCRGQNVLALNTGVLVTPAYTAILVDQLS